MSDSGPSWLAGQMLTAKHEVPLTLIWQEFPFKTLHFFLVVCRHGAEWNAPGDLQSIKVLIWM